MQTVDLPHWDVGPRDGPAIVLLHGFPLDHRMWRAQKDELVAAGFRVLAPDLRGSGKAPLAKSAGIGEMVEDVLRMADRAGVRRFALVGFSIGGYIALELAHRAPERLLALVLVDTRAEPDTAEARAGRAQTAERVRREGIGVLVDAMLPKLLGAYTATTNPALVTEVRETIQSQRPEGMALLLEGMAARADARPWLKDLRAPSLVLVGAVDTLTPPEASRAIAEVVPGAHMEVVPLAAHLSPLESPDAFNVAFLGWLRERVLTGSAASRRH